MSGGLVVGTEYYGYDGHGNVALLTDAAGTVGNTYSYDAYGVLLSQGGNTPNHYQYSGEQWDSDLGMYYLRARYMNPQSGRFWTMDTFEGNSSTPLSLHKYLYAHANPVNGIDPTGHEFSILGVSVSMSMSHSFSAIYNGVVSAFGAGARATLFGAMAGKTMNEILTGFVLEETGLDTVFDVTSAIMEYFGPSDQDQEVADYLEFQAHFDFAILPFLVDDADYAPTDIDEQEPQCFVAGTQILTECGLLPIESVREGDHVWAYDLASQSRVLKPVVRTFVRERSERLRIQIGEDTVEVTVEHPMYVFGKGWVRSEFLAEGDELLTFDGENQADVDGFERLPGAVTVYNFEVQDLHNYFVGTESFLVHNASWKAGFHHFVSRSSGSKTSIGFLERIHGAKGKLSAFTHIAVHRGLNDFLKEYRKKTGINLVPSSANPGLKIRLHDRSLRLRAYSQFYREFQGGRYFPYFQAELKAMVKKGAGLDPALFK